MSKNDNPNEDEHIIDVLLDLMYNVEPDTEKDVDKRLKSHGVDPQQIEARGLALLGKLKRRIRFDAAAKKKSMFDTVRGKFAALKTSVDRRNVIREYMAPSGEVDLVVFNRRLDNISDEYLETLEVDKLLLQLWDDLSNDSEVE